MFYDSFFSGGLLISVCFSEVHFLLIKRTFWRTKPDKNFPRGWSSFKTVRSCLWSKQNNTWAFGEMEFIFSCSIWYTTRGRSNWTPEDKFHISARPYIILYISRRICHLVRTIWMIVQFWAQHFFIRNWYVEHSFHRIVMLFRIPLVSSWVSDNERGFWQISGSGESYNYSYDCL